LALSADGHHPPTFTTAEPYAYESFPSS